LRMRNFEREKKGETFGKNPKGSKQHLGKQSLTPLLKGPLKKRENLGDLEKGREQGTTRIYPKRKKWKPKGKHPGF